MAFEGMTMAMILREALAYTNSRCARICGTVVALDTIISVQDVLHLTTGPCECQRLTAHAHVCAQYASNRPSQCQTAH